jgi:menaquinone-specific isochorismate synthase
MTAVSNGGGDAGVAPAANGGGALIRGRWTLADLVSRTLSEGSGPAVAALGPWVERLEVPVGDVDALRWLRAQEPGCRLYWSGREDGVEVAAVGVADVQEGEAPEGAGALRKRLSPLLSSGDPRVRYFGGMRFDPTPRASRNGASRGSAPCNGEEWEAFGVYRFVLPRFELRRSGGRAVLACNLVLPRDAEVAAEIVEQVEDMGLPSAPREDLLPEPVSRSDAPDFRGWTRNIERALAAFETGRMDKVVLARRAELSFGEELDAVALVERLKDATTSCFHYLMEPEEGVAFVGASPERLFRREGRSLRSEAVAGTRPRGTSDADDDQLRDELLNSLKDQSEHSYVRISIEETLRDLCDDLDVEERASEMKLARGRHLVSGIRGTLRGGVSDADVLHALHPTPAVGGYPKEVAVAEIRELEPFDRGWYAGPVGWIGADGAEFAVGIRSGLVRGRSLALFSGAGIVAGSTPEGEWAEIEQKIGDFVRVFGHGLAGHAAP